MGKFLKILRYIANLIAIMGTCFSKVQQDESNSSLTQLLLDGQKRSDFKPVQGVSSIRPPKSPEVEAFLSSHVEQTEFWRNLTVINSQDVSNDSKSVFLHGSGPVPPIVEDYEQQTEMSLKMIYYTSSETKVRRTQTGFVIDIREKSFKLTNFDTFLKLKISEGDFKEDLVDENPDNYQEIWAILTSGGPFVALYY
jgi:hypothetical protein